MARIDNLKADQLAAFSRKQRQLGAATPLKHSSVSNGRTRFIGPESLVVDGSSLVQGEERVTGTFYLDGVGYVAGTFVVNGTLDVNGPASIDGTLGVNGATTLNSSLTLGSGGRIYVGNITLDPVGSGGQITSSGFLRLVAATGFQLIGSGTVSVNWGVAGNLSAATLSVSGAKTFSMINPTDDSKLLQHGATESPVSGIEYWGEGVIGASGRTTIVLPHYFEALAKPNGRTVFVTGRGFAADWDSITAGKFVVRGVAEKKFSWLVKAERFGGDFEVEPLIEESRRIELDAEARHRDASDGLVVGEDGAASLDD